MKKRIENYLPRALEIVKELGIAENDEVPSEFNGYISSFGAAIIQSGLKQAATFFSNENSRTDQDRAKIVKAVYLLICDNPDPKAKSDALSKLLEEKGRTHLMTEKVIDASVALKLAIRTYKLK
ncbi:MAG: hypothetical protein K8S18_04230 [Desulfobacula sp.]|nr:hypothetical protein [Desulfobacula sp.]